jgi:NAD(P)-dependent dehydrogenase (short-subunit alcohol dehydrogenase family)
MNDVLGYHGKNVVITGAASGMGQAAAQLLVDLGANVYALDIADVSVPVQKAIEVDMQDGGTIDAALAEVPEEIYALWCRKRYMRCSTAPGYPARHSPRRKPC